MDIDTSQQSMPDREDVGDVVHMCATSARIDNPTAAAAALRGALYNVGGQPPTTEWAVTLLGVYCNQIPDGPADIVVAATRMATLAIVEPAFSLGHVDLGTSMLRLIFKLDKALVTVHVYGFLLTDTRTLNPKAVHYIAQTLIHIIHSEGRNQRVVLRALASLVAVCHPTSPYHDVILTCDLRCDMYDTFTSALQSSHSHGPTRAQAIIGLGVLSMPSDDLVSVLRTYCDHRTEACARVRCCATDTLCLIATTAELPRAVMCLEPVLRAARFDPDEEVALHATRNIHERVFPAWATLSRVAELFPSLVCTQRILSGNDGLKSLINRFSQFLQNNVCDVGMWVILHGLAKITPEALHSSLRGRIAKALPLLKSHPHPFAWCCKTLTALHDTSANMEFVRGMLTVTTGTTLTCDAMRALVQYAATRELPHALDNLLQHSYCRLPSSLATQEDRNNLALLCSLLHSSSNAPTAIIKDVAMMLLMLTFELPDKGLGPNSSALLWGWRRTLPSEEWRTCSECLLDVLRTHHRSLRTLLVRAATPQYLFGEKHVDPVMAPRRVVALDTLHDLCMLTEYTALSEVFPHVIRNAAVYTSDEVLCALEGMTHLTQEGSCRIGSDLLGPLLALIGANHYGIKQRAFDMVSRLMTTSDHVVVVGSLLQAVFVLNCLPHTLYTLGVQTLDSVPHTQRHHVYKHFLGSIHRKNPETITKLLEVITSLLVAPPDDTATAHGYWCAMEDLLILCGQLGMRPTHPLYATAASLISNCPCDVPSQVWTRLQMRSQPSQPRISQPLQHLTVMNTNGGALSDVKRRARSLNVFDEDE